MTNLPKTAILIPTYNQAQVLNIALSNLMDMKGKELFDIYVIDNNSQDKTNQIIRKYKKIHYLKLNANYFASYAINKGFKKFNIKKKYKYLLIMAHDVLVNKNTCLALLRYMETNPFVGLTGTAHYEYNTSILRTTGHSINHFTSLLVNYLNTTSKKINHFSSFFMTTTYIFDKIGGLNHTLFPMIYEEPDLGERILKNGYQIRSVIKAKIWHPIELRPNKLKKIFIRKNRIYSTPEKTYFFFRNRILYMSLHVNFFHFCIFFFVYNPVICFYYLMYIKKEYLKHALQGYYDGTIFAFTKNVNFIKKRNEHFLGFKI